MFGQYFYFELNLLFVLRYTFFFSFWVWIRIHMFLKVIHMPPLFNWIIVDNRNLAQPTNCQWGNLRIIKSNKTYTTCWDRERGRRDKLVKKTQKVDGLDFFLAVLRQIHQFHMNGILYEISQTSAFMHQRYPDYNCSSPIMAVSVSLWFSFAAFSGPIVTCSSAPVCFWTSLITASFTFA